MSLHQSPIQPPVTTSQLAAELEALQKEVVACDRCPRLIAYCRKVAVDKRRAYRDWQYWGKPVPSFGDPEARLLIIGLAPAAHGANRTGRMFTGDRSGDFLYDILYRTGFASQPVSRSRDDGLRLYDCYITAAVRCAPPANKPTAREILNCRVFLERELELLPNLKVVVTLGRVAFDVYLSILKLRGVIKVRAAYEFGHNRLYEFPKPTPALISSYHPSQQNTLTGRLTHPMLMRVFRRARAIIER